MVRLSAAKPNPIMDPGPLRKLKKEDASREGNANFRSTASLAKKTSQL